LEGKVSGYLRHLVFTIIANPKVFNERSKLVAQQTTMSDTLVNVMPFEPANYQWQLEPMTKFARMNADHPIAYEMGLTPRLLEDPEWCVFIITPIKGIISKTNGRVFNYRWTYGYRIQRQGNNLTPQFLFNLMIWVWESFKEHFNKVAKGTHVENKLMDKPTFADTEGSLKKVIMMQGATRQ
jgi:hypothetical protein